MPSPDSYNQPKQAPEVELEIKEEFHSALSKLRMRDSARALFRNGGKLNVYV